MDTTTTFMWIELAVFLLITLPILCVSLLVYYDRRPTRLEQRRRSDEIIQRWVPLHPIFQSPPVTVDVRQKTQHGQDTEPLSVTSMLRAIPSNKYNIRERAKAKAKGKGRKEGEGMKV